MNADDYMTLSSGRLLIGAVRSRDAGRYRCSGYNDVIDARAWSPAAYRLHVVDGILFIYLFPEFRMQQYKQQTSRVQIK